MKPLKPIIGIGALILVVVAVVGAVVADSGGSKTSSNSSGKTTVITTNITSDAQYEERKACDILTPSIAQQIAGSDASVNDTPSTNSGDAVKITSCSYFSAAAKISVGLLVRSASNQQGADTNRSQFTNGLPADAQKILGYGDAAYWSPSYAQFNILAHNNWYILSVGPAASSSRTLAQSQQFADLVKGAL